MSFFGKVDTPPQEKPISGYYISNTGKQIEFTISPDVGSRYYIISFINIDNDTLNLLKSTFKYTGHESSTMSIIGSMAAAASVVAVSVVSLTTQCIFTPEMSCVSSRNP